MLDPFLDSVTCNRSWQLPHTGACAFFFFPCYFFCVFLYIYFVNLNGTFYTPIVRDCLTCYTTIREEDKNHAAIEGNRQTPASKTNHSCENTYKEVKVILPCTACKCHSLFYHSARKHCAGFQDCWTILQRLHTLTPQKKLANFYFKQST